MANHDGIAQRLQEFDIHAVGGIGPVEPEMRDAIRDAQQNRVPDRSLASHLSSIRILSFLFSMIRSENREPVSTSLENALDQERQREERFSLLTSVTFL